MDLLIYLESDFKSIYILSSLDSKLSLGSNLSFSSFLEVLTVIYFVILCMLNLNSENQASHQQATVLQYTSPVDQP